MIERWHACFRFDPDAYEPYRQGRIDFFAHEPMDVGNPVQWHRDPLTGITSPLEFGKYINYRDESQVGNIKFVWELGRHQHLVPLAVAYAVSGDESYRTAVLEQIEAWIAQNPFAVGIHWCSSLEVALRLISWALIHSLFALRDGAQGIFAASAVPEAIGQSIFQQAWFIRHYFSLFSSANNHLIGELCGLWVATTVFELGREGELWREEARRGLEREMFRQVYEDGVNKEQAFHYHLEVLEYFLFSWVVGARSGQSFSRRFRDRMIAMSNFLRDISPPGGDPPHVGDSDDGCVARFDPFWPRHPYRQVLEAVDVVFGNAQPSWQKSFWYAAIAGKRSDERERSEIWQRKYPVSYRKGGYVVLGGNGLHLVFDAGPLGYLSIAAHGHADALSFCLAVDGDWWLVDPGTYSYHGEPEWRNYFRGTAAHNTVQVAGRDQSVIGGPFLWLRKANAWLEEVGREGDVQWCGGCHDGYSRLGWKHCRTVRLDVASRRLEIWDRLVGRSEQSVSLHFHFAPQIEVRPVEGGWLAFWPGKNTRLVIRPEDGEWWTVRGRENPIGGWYSSGLGMKQPAITLRGHYHVVPPVEIKTIIQIKDGSSYED
ncbi:alginate lyase family protein [Methylomarinovum tepidoasis]|uniref:alginate lyase family protein n=1 Tax=Methylomarinovum tepidoasis TaxID=2840183 RepID=UPI0025723298|nr:alginate lyase family protein [Methylomarinovum sp. IN45]